MEMELGRNQSELFGKLQCVSIVLHHLLKELPTEVVCSNGVDILDLIECSNDCSFDQVISHYPCVIIFVCLWCLNGLQLPQ